MSDLRRAGEWHARCSPIRSLSRIMRGGSVPVGRRTRGASVRQDRFLGATLGAHGSPCDRWRLSNGDGVHRAFVVHATCHR